MTSVSRDDRLVEKWKVSEGRSYILRQVSVSETDKQEPLSLNYVSVIKQIIQWAQRLE